MNGRTGRRSGDFPTTMLVHQEAIRSGVVFATVAMVVGIAQTFRTHVELVLGVAYIAASVTLLVGLLSRRAMLLFVGYGAVGVSFAARSVSAPFIPGATWHGTCIVGVTWGALALLSLRWLQRLRRYS